MLRITETIAGGGVVVSPSIIAADLSTAGQTVNSMNSDIVDLIHLDVMDGHFVPNLTFGPGYIRNLSTHTSIPLDAHLMIGAPENSISSYLELNVWGVTVHYEATRFPARLLAKIREAGKHAGLAINPATPLESIFDLIFYADKILVMSVDPGFYGQPFMKESLKRVERLAAFALKEGHKDLLIQIDGGINKDNIKDVVSSGARLIVAGDAVFKDGNVNDNAAFLKASAAGR
ncbi:MAG: ribulose-phosphate 3-epimerase [Leptospirales bacterium]|nr:ribulose-phosphate 3-epimerase [Leptospirales bacterium]